MKSKAGCEFMAWRSHHARYCVGAGAVAPRAYNSLSLSASAKNNQSDDDEGEHGELIFTQLFGYSPSIFPVTALMMT